MLDYDDATGSGNVYRCSQSYIQHVAMWLGVSTAARGANGSSSGLLEMATTEANGDEMMSIRQRMIDAGSHARLWFTARVITTMHYLANLRKFSDRTVT